MKAIFLDRDGTIIIDKHYLHKPEEVEYFSDSFEAMKLLQDAGYELFIVTNQSGVARGYFPLEDVNLVHDKMQEDMLKNGLKPYKDIAVSPHAPEDESGYRKPGPLMILDLSTRWDIDLENSYMLGDKLSDAQAGENAKSQGILLRKPELKEHKDYPYFDDLLSFAKSVI
jgi:D-glycero-D-manno-heptose 1,7-bisphosphate phosphatase